MFLFFPRERKKVMKLSGHRSVENMGGIGGGGSIIKINCMKKISIKSLRQKHKIDTLRHVGNSSKYTSIWADIDYKSIKSSVSSSLNTFLHI